jgi:hypothetical protein
MHNSYNVYVSSKEACRYLLSNFSVNGKIISSKPIVRGVRFFTDKEVAVLNIRGEDFFSPHPIPYFDSDEKARVFLQKQQITFGVLTKSGLTDIRRISETYKLKLDILKVIGDEYIVRVSSSV